MKTAIHDIMDILRDNVVREGVKAVTTVRLAKKMPQKDLHWLLIYSKYTCDVRLLLGVTIICQEWGISVKNGHFST